MNITEQAYKLYGISDGPYTKFPRIKKRKDGTKKIRWIYAPEPALKKVQQTILKSVLYRFVAHPCAQAYVVHKNIRSGAYQHIGSKYMIVLDLKDFFPTISKEMVRKTFDFYQKKHADEKSTPCKIDAWDRISQEAISKAGISNSFPTDIRFLDLLLEFCTYDGIIPQGAPTSGAISNIVMYPLDCLFEQVAETQSLAYTRYADDLTFSGNDLENLKRIVFGYVFKKINEHGFTINKSKVHVFQGDQKIVTGLNIHDEGVRPCRKYRRTFRARMANLRKEILATTSLQGLKAVLSDKKALRSELGSVWYLQYNDTYSSANQKMLMDYFMPIADHIGKFYPGFSVSSNFKRNAIELDISSSRGDEKFEYGILRSMHCEMYKMRRQLTSCTAPYQTPSQNSLRGALLLKDITYKERRDLIKISLDSEVFARDLKYLTVKEFNTIMRFASPEDKPRILKQAISSGIKKTSLFFLVCEYITRFPYSSRLDFLRELEKAKESIISGEFNIMKLSIHLRKIMRGIHSSDLIEFLTSSNPVVRSSACGILSYRNLHIENDVSTEVNSNLQI
jgi:hypothetical protein